jgi:hypothetical protein
VAHAVRSGERLAGFDVRALDVTEHRVKLVLHGVRKTASSLVLAISLSGGTAGSVPAGKLYTYGEGSATGRDTEHRFFPVTLTLDITAALRRLSGAERIDVALHILDAHGRELADQTLLLDGVELVVETPE